MNTIALHYLKKGLISQSDFEFLKELDPSPTKKYLPFILKSYLASTNLDLLNSRITEYDTLLKRNQLDRKDINTFKTFLQLDEYVQHHNNIKSSRALKREVKRQAEIILDNENLFVVSPLSHSACCLYGAGTRWCVTMQNAIHFERYYYEQLVTFYFIQVRSNTIKAQLKEDLWKLAAVIYRDGCIAIYDAADHQIAGVSIRLQNYIPPDELFKVLGVEVSLFIPRSMDERLEDYLSYNQQDYATELDISKTGITRIPDSIGEMTQLKSLTLSENNIITLPESIGLLTNLKRLYLFHNRLASLPVSLYNMKQLQWLGLTGNPLSSRSIRDMKRTLPDTRIYMDK